jgi:hypothetical protein
MFRPSIRFCASALFAVASAALFFFLGARETQTQKEASVAEAVFRKLLEMPDVNGFPEGRGVCISDDERRFGPNFVRRFEPRFPGLRYSGRPSVKSGPNPHSVTKCEIFLSVGKISWRDSRDADVEGGYYCGLTCAWGGRFHVRRSGWGWHVDEVNPMFISELWNHPGLRGSESCVGNWL